VSAAPPSAPDCVPWPRSASCARAAAPAPTSPDGPPTLGAEALSFLAALHKFTVDDVYEARRILEVGAAGLAAERATPEQLATLADEVAGLFASLNDRQVFLVHDINFHRGIAAASGNPIVASFGRDGLCSLLLSGAA
jgi:DNA-binding FadR family transcriptional regulator